MIDHIEEELTDGISEEELRVFYEVIRKITDNVEKYTGKGEGKEEPDD